MYTHVHLYVFLVCVRVCVRVYTYVKTGICFSIVCVPVYRGAQRFVSECTQNCVFCMHFVCVVYLLCTCYVCIFMWAMIGGVWCLLCE